MENASWHTFYRNTEFKLVGVNNSAEEKIAQTLFPGWTVFILKLNELKLGTPTHGLNKRDVTLEPVYLLWPTDETEKTG